MKSLKFDVIPSSAKGKKDSDIQPKRKNDGIFMDEALSKTSKWNQRLKWKMIQFER